MKVIYRPANERDIPFVLSSWLKSYRQSEFAQPMPNEIYYDNHTQIIKNILSKAYTIMICDPDDDNHIYGFICAENTNKQILHYMYVKYTYRNFKICENALMTFFPDFKKENLYLTHIDKTYLRKKEDTTDYYRSSFFLKKKDDYKLIYNPYLLV